jgi:hypothetical protein
VTQRTLPAQVPYDPLFMMRRKKNHATSLNRDRVIPFTQFSASSNSFAIFLSASR